jgi:hypothetical protein
MDEGIFDPKFNDLLAVKTLFMSSGWLKYEDRVKSLLVSHEYMIDQITKNDKILKVEDIPEINRLMAKCAVYRELLEAKKEMLDEVDPNWEAKEEKTTFDIPEQEAPKPYEPQQGKFINHIAITPNLNKKSPTEAVHNTSENK